MAARPHSFPAWSYGAPARASLGLILAVVLTFLAVLPASAGDGTWTRLASLDGETYPGYSVAVDPMNPAVLLVGQTFYGGHSGIYRSADRGRTWTEVACGLSVGISSLQFVPSDPQVVYAWVNRSPADWPGERSPDQVLDDVCSRFFAAHGRGNSLGDGERMMVNGEVKENDPTTGGLYQSLDGGKTWKRLQLPAKNVNFGRGVGLFLDPNNAKVVYATLSDDCKDPKDCKVTTYRSTDQGKTWKRVPGDDKVKSDQVSPYGPDNLALVNPLNHAEVFATRDGAVVRSIDAGRTFSPLGSPFGDILVGVLALDRANPQTLYAGSRDGVWAYTFAPRADSLPKSGDPLAEALPILAVLAAMLALIGLQLRAAQNRGGEHS